MSTTYVAYTSDNNNYCAHTMITVWPEIFEGANFRGFRD